MGVTAEGYVRRTQAEILTAIETDQLSEIDPALDMSADQPLGQLNGIMSRHLSMIEELIEVCYHAFDPDAAEDDRMTNIAKLTGTERRGASYTLVSCTIDVDSGTTLESGVHFGSLAGDPTTRFTPETDYTATSSGAHFNVVFRAEFAGPVACPAGQLNVIATPVVGWNSITNAEGDTGDPADDDQTLRTRREEAIAQTGSSTVDAIAADLEDGIDAVQSATVTENVTNVTDANGLPPHSFEALIYDGDPPAADDDEIAQIIWDNKPAGIRSYGSTGDSGTAVDRLGVNQIVNFSRVTPRPIYLEYDITTTTGYPGDAALKTYVADQANVIFSVADNDVLMTRLVGLPYAIEGVKKVISLKLGFAASPTTSTDLSIGAREIARFSSARITIV